MIDLHVCSEVWILHFCQMSNQRVCADRHLEPIYFQTRDISGKILSNKFIQIQMFFFMARVLLIKVAMGRQQKYHRHCCSHARKDGEVFFVKKIGAPTFVLAFNNFSIICATIDLQLNEQSRKSGFSLGCRILSSFY